MQPLLGVGLFVTVVFVSGCAAPTPSASPSASHAATTSAVAVLSPSPDSWPDGMPHTFGGEPVLAGDEIDQRVSRHDDTTSFLVGGFVWGYEDVGCTFDSFCGFRGVGPRTYDLHDTPEYPVGSSTFAPFVRLQGRTDIPGPTSLLVYGGSVSPRILRVHIDPTNQTCGGRVFFCPPLLTVDAIAWVSPELGTSPGASP